VDLIVLVLEFLPSGAGPPIVRSFCSRSLGVAGKGGVRRVSACEVGSQNFPLLHFMGAVAHPWHSNLDCGDRTRMCDVDGISGEVVHRVGQIRHSTKLQDEVRGRVQQVPGW